MSLRGQGRIESGYAMAALLVALAVMSVLMSVALPVWRHDARREKEEELIFRGNQYVRAIRLYNMQTRGFPPSVDILVTGHYLRKKFKDPITNDDFEIVPAAGGQPQPGPPQQGAPGRGTVGAPQTGGGFGPPQTTSGGIIAGGMIGVRSKSKDESIRLFQSRNHYNEWVFMYVAPAPTGGPGRGGPGGGPVGPGGPGGPGRGGTGREGSPFGRPGGPGGGPGRGPTPFPPGGPGRGRGGL